MLRAPRSAAELAAWILPGLLLLARLAHAKREFDYVPPPFLERFGRSVVGVVPLAALVVLVCMVLIVTVAAVPRSAIGRFLKISCCLVIAGSLLAACDGLNDEGLEPWFLATFLVAPLPSISLLLLRPPPRPVELQLLAVFVVFPTWLVLVIIGPTWQHWAVRHGIPGTW